MSDYKELLEILRNIGKYGTINNAFVSPTMLAAADAIEQLVKERDAAITFAKEFRECCSCPNRCFD